MPLRLVIFAEAPLTPERRRYSSIASWLSSMARSGYPICSLSRNSAQLQSSGPRAPAFEPTEMGERSGLSTARCASSTSTSSRISQRTSDARIDPSDFPGAFLRGARKARRKARRKAIDVAEMLDRRSRGAGLPSTA